MARTDIVLNTKSTGAAKAARDADLVKKSWLTTASELANVWRVAGKAISAVGKLFTAQIDAAGKWVDMVDQVNVATGGNAQAMIDWSDSVAQATGQSQDYIFELGKLSLQFTNNHEKSNEMAQAALVMSKTLGIDAQSALRMLSQSLTGTAGRMKQFIPEVANMTAEQLKAGEVIDAVNNRLGPQYEATLGNWATQYNKLANVIGDRYLEALSLTIADNNTVVAGLKEFNEVLITLAPSTEDMSDLVKDIAIATVSAAKSFLHYGAIVENISAAIITVMGKIGTSITQFLLKPFHLGIQAAQKLAEVIELPPAFQMALDNVEITMTEIENFPKNMADGLAGMANNISASMKTGELALDRVLNAMENADGKANKFKKTVKSLGKELEKAAKTGSEGFEDMSFDMEALDFGLSKTNEKTEESAEKQEKKNKKLVEYIGIAGIATSVSNQLFDMMLNGTDDVAGSFVNMGQQAANAVFNQALSSAISHAIESATGAQASMSTIPVVGPLLGIAAAGAALSFGLGLVAKLRSEGKPKGAAYGTEIRGGIPGFDSIPIMAKAGEKILNPTEAREYEAMQRGRLNQGNNMINVNVGMITPVSRSQTQRQIRETVALEMSRLIRKNKLSFGRA